MQPSTQTPAQQLTSTQFKAVLAAVLMVILLGAIEQTIVSVALPTITQKLQGFAWMSWVVSAYLIASTVVTPIYGRLGDLFGRHLVLCASIALFVIASITCALAQSMPQLVAARVLQGIGGGGLITLAQATVGEIAPLKDQGRYQSYISTVWALAAVIGPVAGGLLTHYLSWPWIFWINLPVGIIAFALTWFGLKGQATSKRRARIDWIGAALLIVMLVTILLPITRMGHGTHWADTTNVLMLLVGITLLLVFIAFERHTVSPIVPLHLFTYSGIRINVALTFICFFLFMAVLVIIPLYLKLALQQAPNQIALLLLPFSLGVSCASISSGRLMTRYGSIRPWQRLGIAMVPLGLLALYLCPPQQIWLLCASTVLLSFGLGLQFPTALVSAQNSAVRADIGAATSLVAFFRLLGGAAGTAVLIAVFTATLNALVTTNVSTSEQILSASDISTLLQHHTAAAHMLATEAVHSFRRTLLYALFIAIAAIPLSYFLPDIRLPRSGRQNQGHE